ncbi:MAG: GNAT family N-acetyltransferase [Kiloniella sp.]|nr:GNAT family N-acetyltransferase [Kiloniella sp.]RZO29566.1 MAG: GNAT family N-acetyltransferase [Rhodospirillaceae bacterium]
MTTTVHIRPLRKSDHADWARLWTDYLEFYDTKLSEEVYRVSFERLLADDPHEYSGLIAEVEGESVGLAHFLFHRSMWTIENTCYLMDLFVDPAIRGKGIGRSLIEAVHKAARAAGITETYWQTQEFNYKGRMLYDQVASRTPFIIYSKED